jgi:hypothetical protein
MVFFFLSRHLDYQSSAFVFTRLASFHGKATPPSQKHMNYPWFSGYLEIRDAFSVLYNYRDSTGQTVFTLFEEYKNTKM